MPIGNGGVDFNSETSNVVVLSDRRARANTAAFSAEDLQTSWVRGVSSSISRLATLERGWDTYDGLPPSQQAMTFAGMIAAGLWRNELPRPHVSATSSASIMLEWQNHERELTLEIHGPMRISYLFVDQAGAETAGEATDSLAPLTELIARLCEPLAVAQQA